VILVSKRLHHKTKNGEVICYAKVKGTGPTLVWLGGFRSDMEGTKAEFAHNLAISHDLNFIRFDYFGHGQSSGKFEDGSIGQWRDDALEVIDHLTEGTLVLVGSSMGGWIALLCALARPEQVSALTLIAPAPDFTRTLMWDGFDEALQQEILQKGVWQQPSPYGPVPITRQLIEEADQHLLLHAPIAFDGPVRILQGQKDMDVPWTHAFLLLSALTSKDVVFSLSKSGDHSLSTPDDLARLQTVLLELAAR
jgi:pimeloyl-ACP methyl ester carboxylesterase